MLYKIEKPNNSSLPYEKMSEILTKYFNNKDSFDAYILSANYPEYIYWDKLKYKPLPEGLSVDESWPLIKFLRKAQSTETIITDEKSAKNFSWMKLPHLEEFLHNVDLNTGGNLFSFVNELDSSNRNRFISRGVMEEAIASSQLEGAHTTRKVAKQFLREGRKPKNESEKMILNNYLTMSSIESEYRNRKLSKEFILELHSKITKDTIAFEEQGRFRRDDEEVVVTDKSTGIIYHIPPKQSFIEIEIEKLVEFANDEDKGQFIHPVIKAIMLHFWIGYLHPFTDGNGRLARLLFYWYLLKHNYWAFAYLPISKIIKKSPQK